VNDHTGIVDGETVGTAKKAFARAKHTLLRYELPRAIGGSKRLVTVAALIAGCSVVMSHRLPAQTAVAAASLEDGSGSANTPEYGFWGIASTTKAGPMATDNATGSWTQAFMATHGTTGTFEYRPSLAEGGTFAVTPGSLTVVQLQSRAGFWLMPDAAEMPEVDQPKPAKTVQQGVKQRVENPPMPEMPPGKMMDIYFDQEGKGGIQAFAVIRGPQLELNTQARTVHVEVVPSNDAVDRLVAANDAFATIAPKPGEGNVQFLSESWLLDSMAQAWAPRHNCGVRPGNCPATREVVLFYIDLNGYNGGEIGPTGAWVQQTPGGPFENWYTNYKFGD